LLVGWALITLQGLVYATLPGPFALIPGKVLNAFSASIFRVTMPVVADLTRRTGGFNPAIGTLGMAISIDASLSTFYTASRRRYSAPRRQLRTSIDGLLRTANALGGYAGDSRSTAASIRFKAVKHVHHAM
jgi:hypothetical protein